MGRESPMQTQRNCTLQVFSHLKCCQNTGSFQCHQTVVSGQIHLGENLGRQGLLGTLHTLRRSPCHTSAAFPHLCSRLSCLRPQHRAALRSCCQAPAQASACGMLPRPGLPEQGSWQRRGGKFGEKRLGPPQTKQRVREVGHARSNPVSCWAAAVQLISAQSGLTWRIKLQINLVY